MICRNGVRVDDDIQKLNKITNLYIFSISGTFSWLASIDKAIPEFVFDVFEQYQKHIMNLILALWVEQICGILSSVSMHSQYVHFYIYQCTFKLQILSNQQRHHVFNFNLTTTTQGQITS